LGDIIYNNAQYSITVVINKYNIVLINIFLFSQTNPL